VQLVRLAASRTPCTAGKNIAIKIAMIAMTTNNSIREKPFFCFIIDTPIPTDTPSNCIGRYTDGQTESIRG
jgi:hypothetical protein